MLHFLHEIKKAVVFLGKSTDAGKEFFYATGFLVSIQNIYHLVTAKHCVVDPITDRFIDSGMLVFFNLKDGGTTRRSVDQVKDRFSVNWVFHENKHVDIAMIPFGIDPQKDDVLSIPDNMFLAVDGLFETFDVFFLSYQPGIEPQKRIASVVRRGTISLINDDKTFYIDGSAFPGNSGSPVFTKPSPISFTEKGIAIGGDELGGKFIGIIGEYVPYKEVAVSTQTGRPRVIFEKNTGLSKVWSVNYIREIMESITFRQQLHRMLQIKNVSFPM